MYKRLSINLSTRSYFIDRLVVEVSHIIGYFSIAAVFPILSFNEARDASEELIIDLKEAANFSVLKKENNLILNFVPSKQGIQECCWYLVNHFEELTEHFQSYSSKKKSIDNTSLSSTAFALKDLTFNQNKTSGLASIFDKGSVLLDQNNDFLPDFIDAEIPMNTDWTKSQLIAASNLALRLGLEVTTLNYPLVSDTPQKSYQFYFQSSDQTAFYQEGSKFIFAGDGFDLVILSTYVCESFPMLKNGLNWVHLLETIARSLAMQNLDGELVWLEKTIEKGNVVKEAQLSPKCHSKIVSLQKKYPKIIFKGFKDPQQVYQKKYEQQWEVDVFKQQTLDQLFSKTKPSDTLKIVGALSEDNLQLKKIHKWLEEEADKYQINLNYTVVSSYKEGLSWIVEALAPKLTNRLDIDSITIYFRPFLPTGETEWLDEDGSTPKYSYTGKGNEAAWLDLPIRFLQELYPVDDILADKLNISREAIVFKRLEETAPYTYQVIVRNSAGKAILNENWEVLTTEQPYLEQYPEQGLVHPNTSFIKGYINEKMVLQERIPSDLETVWQIFQNNILPDVRKYCLEKMTKAIAAEEQPLFSQLKIEIFISEPDEKLISRQDLYSSLDALQEDIYFVGLDYFKCFGQEHGGIPLDAPGLILPIIHKTTGPPKVVVSLLEQTGQQSGLFTTEGMINPLKEKPSVFLSRLEIVNQEVVAIVSVDGEIFLTDICQEYCQQLESGLLDINSDFQGIGKLIVVLNNEHYFSAKMPKMKKIDQNQLISEVTFYEEQLIGYEEYLQVIEQLKKVKELNVYPIAETYQGREIHAIELRPKWEGYVSRVKRINQFPSEIINARHHANEVSGTNGVFLLIKELLQNPKYEKLSETMNLTLIPFENADGAALHYELQKEHPEWKFHVARFNALGKDFYYEYFNKETIHTEALGFSWMWEKWLPDVVVDNHGVPSHEWEQQFSGYTSQVFKGFWLPRALLYGYFWLIDDPHYQRNIQLNQQLETKIAEAINQQEEMYQWNKEWQNRFEKYAHQWLPKLFPAKYYKNMINYKIPFPYEKQHRYPSVRFPWITTVCYTSEVTDETATGALLSLCGRVHLAHELAVIDELMTASCCFKNEKIQKKCFFKIDGTRQRPIIVANKEGNNDEKESV